MNPTLGRFRLVAPLGAGAMGRVWSAEHVETGQKAAVKVVAPLEGDDRYRRALWREARAVAALDHPNVVAVVDHGVVPPEVATAHVPANGPYLVMELAQRSLGAALPTTWVEVREVLRSVLAGLAHAHARNVVHLDVKPANVLVFPGGRFALADFGLAHAMASSPDESTGGTAEYMAPEQVRGRWRDYGPWTDLYAVAVLAWELVTRSLPFAHPSAERVRRAHLLQDPGDPVPVLPVPDGFVDWIRRGLRKEWADRFELAADAAAALEALGDPVATTLPAPPAEASLVSTFDFEAETADVPLPEAEPEAPRPPDPGIFRRPTAWRSPERPRGSRTGLGLFGLRVVPTVGREAERDRLWAALGDLERGPRAVVLSGPAGIGKSRLCGWLVERAHELGAAVALRAVHADHPGPSDGLLPMMEGAVRAAGLDRDGVAAQLSTRVDRELRDPVLDLLRPTSGRRPEPLPILERWVLSLARRRPVVLWLDDAPFGPEAVALAERLLSTAAPVLLLLTAREEVAWPPGLTALAAHPRADTIGLRPLGAEEQQGLVRELLGLDDALVAQVGARAAGNPLFAVQLVGDWVQRGLLQPTGDGLRLRPGAEPQLPDALHELWGARLRTLLAGRPATDARALELAAVLGARVDPVEWAAACGAAGFAPPHELVDEMERQHLAVGSGQALDGAAGGAAWSFVHGLLVESQLRSAEERGTAEQARRIAADALIELAAADGDQGRWDQAVGRIERARRLAVDDWQRTRATSSLASHLWRVGRLAECRACVAEVLARGEPVDAAGYERRAVAHIALGHAERLSGGLQASREAFERALDDARRAGWRRGEYVALNGLGGAWMTLGDTRPALACFEAAAAGLRELGAVRDLPNVLANLAAAHHARRDLPRAEAAYRETLALIGDQRHGQPSTTLANLASLLCEIGDAAGAEPLFRRAIELQQAHGSPLTAARMAGLLAIAEANLGRVDDALARFEAALARLRGADPQGAGRTLMLRARVHDERGRRDLARADLAESEATLRPTGIRADLALALRDRSWLEEGALARACAEESAALFRSLQDADGIACAEVALAWTLAPTDPGAARALVDAAEPVLTGPDRVDARIRLACVRARSALAEGDRATAAERLAEAERTADGRWSAEIVATRAALGRPGSG